MKSLSLLEPGLLVDQGERLLLGRVLCSLNHCVCLACTLFGADRCF